MKIITLLIIVVVVFSGLGLWLIAYGNETSEERNISYGISMSTDKMNYSVVGEPIKMTFKVFNYTEEDIVFHFNTSQRYDFIIEDKEGNEVWRWSKDRMFAMVLGEEILGPNNPEVIYTAEYKDRLSLGYYKITGIFVAQDRPMSGSIVVEVK
jgi:hypothetical protein